jgi:hypothetical protein
MQIVRQIFDRKGTPVLLTIFVVLFVVEGARRLRKRTQPRWKRVIINSLVSVPAFSPFFTIASDGENGYKEPRPAFWIEPSLHRFAISETPAYVSPPRLF